MKDWYMANGPVRSLPSAAITGCCSSLLARSLGVGGGGGIGSEGGGVRGLGRGTSSNSQQLAFCSAERKTARILSSRLITSQSETHVSPHTHTHTLTHKQKSAFVTLFAARLMRWASDELWILWSSEHFPNRLEACKVWHCSVSKWVYSLNPQS